MDSPDLYRALGSLIRRRRRVLELTQADLSGRLGISRGALANIETGRQQVFLHQLVRFASALEMKSVHELIPMPQIDSEPNQPSKIPLPKGLTANEQSQVTRLLARPARQTPRQED
jgi:transcriptional regulator with XRE-family HTH domain